MTEIGLATRFAIISTGMKITKRRQRTLRKLVLPLIALAMMTTMMAMQSQAGANNTPSTATQP